MKGKREQKHMSQLDEEFSYPQSLLASVPASTSPVKASRSSISKKRSSSTGEQPSRKRANQLDHLHINHQSAADGGLASASEADDALGSSHGAGFREADSEEYFESVLANCAGYYRVSMEFFVVQGWDLRRHQATDHWYHLQFVMAPEGARLGCSCPAGSESDCLHRRFFQDHEVQNMPYDSSVDEPGIRSSMFLRQLLADGTFLTKFSVSSSSSAKLKGRAVVTHTGRSATDGSWRCSKDQARICPHISLAKDSMPLSDEDLGESALGDCIVCENLAFSIKKAEDISVSYMPILPPAWASLPTDQMHYARPTPCRSPIPNTFSLGISSLCSCPLRCSSYNPTARTVLKKCKVYTLLGCYETQIELQACPRSPPARRRFIGPDPRDIGVFNYNNSVLVSHELLDEYTSAFCSSETPFSAWMTVVSRRYRESSCALMGEDLFRSVWFAYAKLQQFEGDMSCIRCGIHPDTVIWDGVTLAFGKKHLTDTLSPPTKIGASSLSRDKTRYQPHQQLIRDSGLRKSIRQILKHSPAVEDSSDSADLDEPASVSNRQQRLQEKRASAAISYINLVDSVQLALKSLCLKLSLLVYAWYGPEAMTNKVKVPQEYRNLLRQVAAEESVLQMVNYPSLIKLREFLQTPSKDQAGKLLSIPALYSLVLSRTPLEDTLPILFWIEKATRDTIIALNVEQTPLGPGHLLQEGSWIKTGCCYSMPQIRERPAYPKLRDDTRKDKSTNRGGKCNKYYSQYGQQRLTGGIVAVWCTHSICYGFHSLSDCEGRNDVFSAMVTRWPTAPKRVIYDFACALGPYCMLREPDFFRSTSFLIDHFHSTGHTKCSRACFLSEYSNVDPSLAEINSSAAECGNGGIRKIRKSVSYMGQERAVIYTKVYLSIWNRLKLRKLGGQ